MCICSCQYMKKNSFEIFVNCKFISSIWLKIMQSNAKKMAKNKNKTYFQYSNSAEGGINSTYGHFNLVSIAISSNC